MTKVTIDSLIIHHRNTSDSNYSTASLIAGDVDTLEGNILPKTRGHICFTMGKCEAVHNSIENCENWQKTLANCFIIHQIRQSFLLPMFLPQ